MKNISKYIDLGFYLVVLPLMVMMLPIERWFAHFRTYVLMMGAWLYILYFLNRMVTVRYLFEKGSKKVIGICIVVASIAITYAFSAYRLYTPAPNILDAGITKIFPTVKHYQQAVWSLFMIVESFSFAVSLLIEADRQRERRREVEAERTKAEIALYKAQIKPHFMFNTLNSLYGLFITKSDKAVPSLERFIDMMRYILTASGKENVALEEEAAQIRRYIELQALRLNDKTKIDVDINISDGTLRVPPMLPMTFVENCFKHGVSATEESSIKISLEEKEGQLTLHTSNRIFPCRQTGEHMGIENCRKRLALSYPDRHELTISREESQFTVNLKIKLHT